MTPKKPTRRPKFPAPPKSRPADFENEPDPKKAAFFAWRRNYVRDRYRAKNKLEE